MPLAIIKDLRSGRSLLKYAYLNRCALNLTVFLILLAMPTANTYGTNVSILTAIGAVVFTLTLLTSALKSPG